jgi:DNA-binding transcriptional LysR family regulator
MVSCHPISDAYRVEVQLLRTFVTVARLGSFSAAAVELGYTQAAVSQQIASLEGDLKTRLLNRRPVTATEAGARLLEHAEPILLRLDAARADVTRMTTTPPAALAVGATALAGGAQGLAGGHTGLAAALAVLRERMPRLAVTVQTGSGGELAAAVARGELDLALIDGLAAPGDSLAEQVPVTATGLSEVPVAVVLPTDHPLAGRPSLRLTDLADARWIEADNAAPPLAQVRRHAGTDGFAPALRYAGGDVRTLLALVAAGHGLALLPAAALAGGGVAGCGVVGVPVAQPRLCHRTELVHTALPRRSPAAALAALLMRR